MAAAARDDDEQPLYKDASAPVEARVRDLLGRMTLREKAAQMAQIERTVASPRALAELAAGSGAGSTPRDRASPADWANMVDGMQRLALSSRLGIPILFGTDAVHGHSNVYGATIFPHNAGLGASRYRSIRSRPLIGVFFVTSQCYWCSCQLCQSFICRSPCRDVELARKIGEATALEVRATGIHWTFAPCFAVSPIQISKPSI
jgi:beta-glucosidase